MSMVKLGRAWVDMRAVAAVVPTRDAPGFSLFLNCGRIIGLADVSREDIEAALATSGRIFPVEDM